MRPCRRGRDSRPGACWSSAEGATGGVNLAGRRHAYQQELAEERDLVAAAHAQGLGTCVIGSAVEGLNTPDIRAEIGLPEDTLAVAPIIVGIPAGNGPPAPRQPPRILNWLGR